MSLFLWVSLVCQMVENLPTVQETWVWSLGREDSGEGRDNPLQYSYLENPMDRGAWQATVYGVAKNQTWLSDLFIYSLYQIIIKGIPK